MKDTCDADNCLPNGQLHCSTMKNILSTHEINIFHFLPVFNLMLPQTQMFSSVQSLDIDGCIISRGSRARIIIQK